MNQDKLKEQLRFAQEGLEQMHKSWADGEYEDVVHMTPRQKYNKDVKDQCEGIARIERKLATRQLA